MWNRLANLRAISKLLLIVSIALSVFTLWYSNAKDAQGLLTAKMAVKQLENSDASYLLFNQAQNSQMWLSILWALVVMVTIVVIYFDLREEN